MHIDKEKTRITALVGRFRVVGDMYMYPGARLMDLVNMKEQVFMPITDAEIYSLGDGKLLQKAAFIGLNRNQVYFFYPVDQDKPEGQE
ncbi:MAG: hypothetical protein KKF66_08405 [Actinobacteria bacterium]|nr:hypothetical protein [Actinomycetota bacterium]